MRKHIVGMLVLGFIISGCTGGDESEVPDGYLSLEAPFATLSYPDDWEVTGESDTEVRVSLPTDVELAPSAALTLDNSFSGGEAEFEAAVTANLTIINNVRTDVQELGMETVEIAGATTATLAEFQFNTAQGDAVHHFDLFVLTPAGTLLYGRSESPQETADPQQLRTILESVQVIDTE